MTLLYTRGAGKSKPELVAEIARLERELEAKNKEITLLKKRLSLYKSIDK